MERADFRCTIWPWNNFKQLAHLYLKGKKAEITHIHILIYFHAEADLSLFICIFWQLNTWYFVWKKVYGCCCVCLCSQIPRWKLWATSKPIFAPGENCLGNKRSVSKSQNVRFSSNKHTYPGRKNNTLKMNENKITVLH